MRILEVTHYMLPHLGGIEMVADSLVRGLSARGHTLSWIASGTPEPPGRSGALSRVGAWNVLEERTGIPYPLWSAAGLAELHRLVLASDVVHVHDCLYMGSAAAVAAAKVHHKGVLLTQHVGMVPYGRVLDRVERLAYATLGRTVLAGADGLVACAPHVPAFFRSLGVNKPFTLIRNGIDDTRFIESSAERRAELRALHSVPAPAKVVLFSGRLVAKKGVEKVAALQKSLAADGVWLVVAGTGPLAHELEGLPNTRHLGKVAPSDMPGTYALADVFVLPSRGEGLPLGVQEAMLSGTQVVVSDDPAFRDGLEGMIGVRFADDAESLAAAVRASFDIPVDRAEVRRGALGRWGLEPFLDAYERALDSVASVRSGKRNGLLPAQ